MIADFLSDLERQGKSPLTVKQYAASWGRFKRWFDTEHPTMTTVSNNGPPPHPHRGGSGLGLVLQSDISRFKRWAGNSYKPRTIALTLLQLRVIFDYYVKCGQIPDNPAADVKNVATPAQNIKWLTRNEQNMLVRTVRQHGNLRDLTLITTFLHTGMRVNETVNVKMYDLKLSDRKGLLIVRNGKGGKYREIPLNADVRKVLTTYLAEYPRQADDYLFFTNRSPKMTTRAAQVIIDKYRVMTGIDHLTCHSLRHTFGHELASRKIPLDVVARLMGHQKANGDPCISTTIIYTQPGPDDLVAAVNELEWT
ncbi:tyrosine-type recombinase/integrase [Heliobacterium chlorum]|uniref:Tyrosine-type recombinase/integrase n=1 Tax=Heliobacterium chlorum TaxID=2698 RepID=A0ABR7T513_HELCL|nr:tyrosine-type recombinase/integrase [Heliobacterium chlorum]MBC9785093.1 tyrosine-type recombinase/integrase [Heliobacterium chlorum]